jgi:hypothetical protein
MWLTLRRHKSPADEFQRERFNVRKIVSVFECGKLILTHDGIDLCLRMLLHLRIKHHRQNERFRE